MIYWPGRKDKIQMIGQSEIYSILMNESLPDIKFVDALVYLISELKELKQTSFEKIDEAINDFINQLPRFIQIALKQII